MATSIFNNVEDFSIVFTYSTDANKTAMNILIDTSPRIDGHATQHEETVIMYRGTPSQLRAKLKEALSHFIEAQDA